MADIRRNITLFKWDHFCAGLWPMTAVLSIYFQNITGSYAAAMSVFSVCGLSQAVLEIPTGVFSDRIGRRQTLVLSALLILLCLVMWAAAGEANCSFLLFAGAVLYGASDAFMSGTVDALMFETLRQTGRDDEFKKLYAVCRICNQAGLLTGILTGAAVMYFWSLRVLAWVSVVPMLGQFIVALFYVNPDSDGKAKERRSFKQALLCLRQNKRLRLLGAVEVLDTSFSAALRRMEGVYFETLVAVWTVNLIRGCRQIAGLIGYAFAAFFKRFSSAKLLTGSLLSAFLTEISAVFLNMAATPFIMAVADLFSSTAETAKAELLQREYDENVRATTGSLLSLITAVFQALLFTAAGVLADAFGVRNALIFLITGRLAAVFASVLAAKTKK